MKINYENNYNLTDLVYDLDFGKGILTEKFQQYLQNNPNMKIIGHSNPSTEEGLKILSVYDTSTGILYLPIAGTTLNQKDFLDDIKLGLFHSAPAFLKAWISNILSLVPAKVEHASDFFKESMNILEVEGFEVKSIQISGHSLGGVVAQAFVKELLASEILPQQIDIECTLFDSPGTKDILPSANELNKYITHHRANDNVVNGCGAHVSTEAVLHLDDTEISNSSIWVKFLTYVLPTSILTKGYELFHTKNHGIAHFAPTNDKILVPVNGGVLKSNGQKLHFLNEKEIEKEVQNELLNCTSNSEANLFLDVSKDSEDNDSEGFVVVDIVSVAPKQFADAQKAAKKLEFQAKISEMKLKLASTDECQTAITTVETTEEVAARLTKELCDAFSEWNEKTGYTAKANNQFNDNSGSFISCAQEYNQEAASFLGTALETSIIF